MKKKLGIILVALVLIQLTAVTVQAQDFRFPKPRVKDLSPEELQELENRIMTYMVGKTAVSLINTALMTYIMWFYYVLYRENGSKFSLGLIALSAALMVYSVASNPYLLYQTAKQSMRFAGLFNFLPDLFTTAAAVIMIYLTRT